MNTKQICNLCVKTVIDIISFRSFVAGWGLFWRSFILTFLFYVGIVFVIVKIFNYIGFTINLRAIVFLLVTLVMTLVYINLLNWAIKNSGKKYQLDLGLNKWFWWSMFWRWSLIMVVVTAVVNFIGKLFILLIPFFLFDILIIAAVTIAQLYLLISVYGWTFLFLVNKLQKEKVLSSL
ncbi:MAG: hypothetical protein ABII27_01700 [bacterium]